MELYWLLRLPHLHNMLGGLGILSGILSFVAIYVSLFLKYDNKIDLGSFLLKSGIFLSILSVLSFVGSVLCPDWKDLSLMLGWDAINSDSVQEVIEILKDNIR